MMMVVYVQQQKRDVAGTPPLPSRLYNFISEGSRSEHKRVFLKFGVTQDNKISRGVCSRRVSTPQASCQTTKLPNFPTRPSADDVCVLYDRITAKVNTSVVQ